MALSGELPQYFKSNPFAKFAIDRVISDAFDDRRSFKFLDEFFYHLGREAWSSDDGPPMSDSCPLGDEVYENTMES